MCFETKWCFLPTDLFRRLLVSNIKIISYERFYKSKGIDFNKSEVSKECMICHYWYFKDGFKYQPYVCNTCHGFSMTVQNLSDFFIMAIKNFDYRIYL